MKDFIEFLSGYSQPMLSNGDPRKELDLTPQTDEEFEIEILDWVLAESEEAGVNIHDLRDLIQQRIWKLEL